MEEFPEFPVIRRGGYDRRTVDLWVDDQLAETSSMRAHIGSLEAHLAGLQRQCGPEHVPKARGG